MGKRPRGIRATFIAACALLPWAVMEGCSGGTSERIATDAGGDGTLATDSASDGFAADVTTNDVAVSDASDASDAGDAPDDPFDAGSSDADASAPDCSGIPTIVSRPGPFCFAVADASPDGAAASIPCASAQGEVCCAPDALDSGSFPNSSCIAPGTAAEGYVSGSCTYGASSTGKEWHCTQPSHCPNAGETCCLIASEAGTPKPGSDNDYPKGCNAWFQSSKFTDGTRCRTACAAGEIQLCASDTDCVAGKCVPLSVAGRAVGYCRL